MDTPSILLITDYRLLKIHLLAYYLEVSQFYLTLQRLLTLKLSFHCLALKKQKTQAQATRHKPTVVFPFFQPVITVFIQWT